MQQDRHAELITYLDLAMLPELGETAVLILLSSFSRLWVMFVENEWHARGRTSPSLFVAKAGMQRPTSVSSIDLRTILYFSSSRRTRGWSAGSLSMRKLSLWQMQSGLLTRIMRTGKRLDSLLWWKRWVISRVCWPFSERLLFSQVIPGIVMVGTSPTFFKIPVTGTLSTHIRHGTYPPEETHVTYCHPPVPRPAHRRSEGMKPLESRREILRCYEAFKEIVGIWPGLDAACMKEIALLVKRRDEFTYDMVWISRPVFDMNFTIWVNIFTSSSWKKKKKLYFTRLTY